MTRVVLAMGTVFLCSCCVLAHAPESSTKVDRLCGYLVTETQAGRDSIAQEKIVLYRRKATIDCCVVQDRVAEVQTKKDGKFEFKHIPAGAYWLVAFAEEKEHRIAIDFAPTKDAQDCTWNLYTIDKDGQFVLKTYLT